MRRTYSVSRTAPGNFVSWLFLPLVFFQGNTMARLTKKQVYDRYYGERKMSNAARILSDLVRVCEDTETLIVQSFNLCPRCNRALYEVHTEPKFLKVMTFCKGCHYFLCYDRIGRVKTYAVDTGDKRPLSLPPVPDPARPLERSIYKHMRNIKKESL